MVTVGAIQLKNKTSLEAEITAMAAAVAEANELTAEVAASQLQIDADEAPLWEQKLRSMFKVMDESDNDSVSKEEFLVVFKDAELAETFWDKYNDGNGRLDEAKLISFFKKTGEDNKLNEQ